MTVNRFIFLAALAGALCACQELPPVNEPEEQNQEQPEEPGLPGIDDEGSPSLISAVIPSSMVTKVSLTGEEAGVSLAWEGGDCIRINGSLFSIVEEGMTPSQAGFTGTPVTADTYTVLYPGTYESAASMLSRSYANQKQVGNGSTAHLEWNAMIRGIDNYANLRFEPRVGQEFFQNGIIKFFLDVPSQYNPLTAVALTVGEAVFPLTNDPSGAKANTLTLALEDLGLTDMDRKLSAYLMVPFPEVTIPEGSSYTVSLIGTAGQRDDVVKQAPKGGLVIGGGRVCVIGLEGDDIDEPLFWSGDGSQDNPYTIKTAKHLSNVSKVLSEADGLHFKLLEDIDLEGTDWVTITGTTKTLYFDGNGKTISHFTVPGGNVNKDFASLFGAIGGEVKNLGISQVTVHTGSSNSSAGILCGKADGLVVSNVDASECTVIIDNSPGETTGVGGLIGFCATAAVSACDLNNVQVVLSEGKTPNNVGGLIGALREGTNSVTSCTVNNASITGYTVTGGLIGNVRSACASVAAISDCHVGNAGAVSVEGKGTASSAWTGGLIGGNTYVGLAVSGCSYNGALTGAKNNVGGIIGRCNGAATFTKCQSSGTISGNTNMGGICGCVSALDESHMVTVKQCSSAADIMVAAASNNQIAGLVGAAILRLTISESSYSGTIDVSASTNGNSKTGGLLGTIATAPILLNIENCYSDGAITGGRSYVGGLVGCIDSGGTVNVGKSFSRADITAGVSSSTCVSGLIGGSNTSSAITWNVDKCLAWNGKLDFSAITTYSDHADGIVIGYRRTSSAGFTDCYYTSALVFGGTYKVGYEGRELGDGTVSMGTGSYDGKASSLGLSVQAQACGWSGEIWNFSGSVPVLR